MFFKKKSLNQFYSGQLFSSIGDWLTTIAQVLAIYRITNSSLSIALILLLKFLPKLISPFISVKIIDKYKLPNLLILIDILRAAIVLTSIVAIFLKNIVIFYIIIFLQHFLSGIYFPARIAMLSKYFPDKSEYSKSIAAINSFNSIGMIIGNLFGAVLVSFLNLETIFVIDGITYIFAAITLFFSPFYELFPNTISEYIKGNNIIESLRIGINIIIKEIKISSNIFNICIRLIAESMAQYLVVIFVMEIFKLPENYLAITYLSMGVGPVIGMFLIKYSKVTTALRKNFLILILIILQIILWGIAFYSMNFIVFIILIGLSGIIMMIASTQYESTVFSLLPDDSKGAIASIYTFFRVVSLSSGMLLCTFLSSQIYLLVNIMLFFLIINIVYSFYQILRIKHVSNN